MITYEIFFAYQFDFSSSYASTSEAKSRRISLVVFNFFGDVFAFDGADFFRFFTDIAVTSLNSLSLEFGCDSY